MLAYTELCTIPPCFSPLHHHHHFPLATLHTSTPQANLPHAHLPLRPQLTSDLQNLRTDMHEIDFEFINGDPAPAPGSLWTNMFYEGKTQKEVLITPADLVARTGSKSFKTFSDFHTYTLDWQPDYVRWFVGGWRHA
jgi:hypothetical protein